MCKRIALSKRMQAVADMVSSGNRVCDVGCDHGYVSIYLYQRGIAPCVLAMDINKGPLSKAKEHVRKFKVEDYITLRLSNGLTAYHIGEADTLLCAGMGGRLLMDILRKEPEKTADFKELVLQPQSEIPLVRKFLREKGYVFLREDMILEEGKFYVVMKVRPSEDLTAEKSAEGSFEMEDLLGGLLLKQKHPVLLQYIEKEIPLKQEILVKLEEHEYSDKTRKRKEQLLKELELLGKAKELLKE